MTLDTKPAIYTTDENLNYNSNREQSKKPKEMKRSVSLYNKKNNNRKNNKK